MKKRWVLFLCFLFTSISMPCSASIIKKPPTKVPAEITYKDLTCSEQDKACIYEIISTVGETGKLGLYFKQDHLEELGAQINHVHPLKFLATIFSDPYLKGCMISVWNDYFKKGRFMGGLVPNLTREAEKGKLDQYIPDFAADVGVNLEQIRPFFESRDWDNLVYFLIHANPAN